MSVTRADLETEIRDNIQEASGVAGAIWSDTVLDRHILRELLTLSRRNIYLERTYSVTLTSGTDYSSGIVLPTGTVKVESVERNEGTSSIPQWETISGCDFYGGSLFLPYRVDTDTTIRVKVKKKFTAPSDDSSTMDLDDEFAEIVVWGVTLRCYRMFIGYLRGSVSWDSVTKPGDVAIPSIQNWIRDADKHYKELIQLYQYSPKPRDIDLVH